ncbi:MAG: asparagine synthase (glutamine-hydrolyzing) [Bacteroidetes bacterium]|nr:asparagine synthase (glutamine-hydrolyzing) [Bacteroidota bacterium]
MVNRHDTLFCEKEFYGNGISSSPYNESHVRAIVDGIVLHSPLHDQIPVPACSAIVAASYEKWELDFMDHLKGKFSCAIWDDNAKRLVLARDPYGHKPLHYCLDDGNIFFSSEIKGILAAGAPYEIDLASLSDFLSLNCVPYPATMFKNIHQVRPGSMVIADNSGIREKTYWAPSLSVDYSISLDEAVKQLTESLRRAVKRRMVTKEAYCFLSGGIDSSAIVSFASEISGNRTIHAVSVGFKEEEENEMQDAALMAKHVGAKHHQVIVSPDSFFDMLDTMVFHHDSPFTDTSAYPTYYAAKLGRQFSDVILTGDGPDQIMEGSGHYVFAVRNSLFADRNKAMQLLSGLGAQCAGVISSDPTPSLIPKIERKFHRDSLSPVHAAYDLRSYFPIIVKRYMCTDNLWNVHTKNDPYRHPDSWFEQGEGLDDVNRYLLADMKFYLPDDLMIKVDRMCMAHGLETLSPFLDRDFSEIVNMLPGKYKIHLDEHGQIITKYALKKVCQERFPSGILNKKKQGFGIPLEKWLRQDQGKCLREILLDPRTLNRGYFKKRSMEKLVDVFINNKGDYFFPNANGIVGLLTLELWHRRYLD